MSDDKRSVVWIVGRRARLATNGHEYISEPFVAFDREADAKAAADMIELISGEKPMISTASFQRSQP